MELTDLTGQADRWRARRTGSTAIASACGWTSVGSVSAVGDGIAWVTGLPSAAIDDILDFEDGSMALVFDLTPDRVGAVLLQQTPALTAGTRLPWRSETLGVPVGDELRGRVVDPLGIAARWSSATDARGTPAPGDHVPADHRT